METKELIMNRTEVTFNSDRFTDEMKNDILNYLDNYKDVAFTFRGTAKQEFETFIKQLGLTLNEDGMYERGNHETRQNREER